MVYIDGFVLIVKKGKLNEYKKMADWAGKMWKKHGALKYVEAVGDDMNPNMGGHKALTFPKMTKPKQGEKVIFSYIVYKNRAHRDKVNKNVMKEMEKMHKDDKDHMKKMPFDMKKMAYGGFKAIVEK